MDNSQTSAGNDSPKPERDRKDDHAERSPDGYYYDDATGYEIYEEEDDQDDDAEDESSGK